MPNDHQSCTLCARNVIDGSAQKIHVEMHLPSDEGSVNIDGIHRADAGVLLELGQPFAA